MFFFGDGDVGMGCAEVFFLVGRFLFECIDSELDGLGMTLGVAFFLGDMTQRRNSIKTTEKKNDIREKCLKLIPIYSNLWT